MALVLHGFVASSCAARVPGHRPLLHVHFDPQLTAADFLNPALRVRVNGHEGWMLVDTGAAVHVWARWFAEEAAVAPAPPPPDARLSDSTGATVSTSWAAAVTLTTAEGVPLRVDRAAVADFPAEFATRRIAGILSPQLLAGEGEAAVLDLQGRTLRVLPIVRARRGRHPMDTASGWVCRPPSAALRSLSYGVLAVVEGHSARLTLDTGANHTRIGGALGRTLKASASAPATSTGLGGVSEDVALLKGARTRFAGTDHKVDLRLSDHPAEPGDCGADGLLGIDALRRCVLVLGQEWLAADCRGGRGGG